MFEQSALDLSIERWADVERYNATLQRLCDLRKPEVRVEGMLAQSKIAWKYAILQQSLLYRVTMLASGCSQMWNAQNVVCSILAARGLMETIAVVDYVKEELIRSFNARDLDALDKLASTHMFATRDPFVIEKGIGFSPVNVLTYIDKFGKRTLEVREHYDFLSEFCHPNANGHFFTFGDLNTRTGVTRFSERAVRVSGIQGHVVTTFMMIGFVELAMADITTLIPKIAELQVEIDGPAEHVGLRPD